MFVCGGIIYNDMNMLPTRAPAASSCTGVDSVDGVRASDTRTECFGLSADVAGGVESPWAPPSRLVRAHTLVHFATTNA